jgi:hypothetical protein
MTFTLAALSDNQTAWIITLVAGLVVAGVVLVLLELLWRSVHSLEESIWGTWLGGKNVVANTVTGFQLKTTRGDGAELLDELRQH